MPAWRRGIKFNDRLGQAKSIDPRRSRLRMQQRASSYIRFEIGTSGATAPLLADRRRSRAWTWV